MEVAMKESSKKKLARSIWAGYVKKGDEKESRCPGIAMGIAIIMIWSEWEKNGENDR